MPQAIGSFEVKVVPQKEVEGVGDPSLGRMSLDKQFHGKLTATSKGQMLSAMTETKGSAGYVAMERVVGELGGRHGSFVLQHNGTMDRGKPGLSIRVVPDSGTGELQGLYGEMTIQIEGGAHRYEFTYDFADGDSLTSA
ncbi:DUF3224 domain-containing protein [Granulicella sibirica]|uniref:DUF3224 domain-containing protein n=1 Tax=Granulicella sibirica TaxID=2479048 RepID=A0A4Q0SZ61_9BACT|nr:DUF3224 domain-containing protein [Granulicella sibirica]RXH56573.1 hypothetical protein GRAN_3430 [Granulicella sibirica]